MGRIEERLMREWRELGFYYDCDYRIGVNQWRFYGSKKGLQNFADILSQYAADKTNDEISEHIHLGPYSYLKIMTWDSPQIHRDYFAGTLEDFKQLSGIVKKFLAECSPGDTFTLHDHFGVNNEMTAKVFVMSDDFDPVSLDELIISDRQSFVNKLRDDK